jgi:cytochrome b subunit of formate dehydrogenase
MAAGGSPGHVIRYNRPARWFHAATYLVTFVLLATGWWLWDGREGEPSLLARLFDRPDTDLHRQAGWVLVGLAGAGLTLGIRGAWRFVRETVRVNRGDGRWFWHWPRGALTGRFAGHKGHFDPGQRIANVAFVVTFGTLIGTGIALTTLHGGPAFVWLVRAHRYATVALAVLVAGHVLLAIGVLPGYRGAWRSMHLGGRVPVSTVRRLWPRSAPDAPTETPKPRFWRAKRAGVRRVSRARTS